MRIKIAKNEHYEMYADIEENRLYYVYKGFWPDTDEFLDTYMTNVRKTVNRLKPGFTSMVDLRRFTIPSPKVIDTLVEVQKIESDAGVRRTARVV